MSLGKYEKTVRSQTHTHTCSICGGTIEIGTLYAWTPEQPENTARHIAPEQCDGYKPPVKMGWKARCRLYTVDQGCPLHGEYCG